MVWLLVLDDAVDDVCKLLDLRHDALQPLVEPVDDGVRRNPVAGCSACLHGVGGVAFVDGGNPLLALRLEASMVDPALFRQSPVAGFRPLLAQGLKRILQVEGIRVHAFPLPLPAVPRVELLHAGRLVDDGNAVSILVTPVLASPLHAETSALPINLTVGYENVCVRVASLTVAVDRIRGRVAARADVLPHVLFHHLPLHGQRELSWQGDHDLLRHPRVRAPVRVLDRVEQYDGIIERIGCPFGQERARGEHAFAPAETVVGLPQPLVAHLPARDVGQ
jgi:hypothetical protein